MRKKYSLMLVILMMGCSRVAPHADLTAPKKMRTGIPVIASSSDYRQVKWWKRMHDPVLNHLIDEALCHNNQLQMARENILQAQANLKAAHFAWLPTLNMKGNGFAGNGFDAQVQPRGVLANTGLFGRINSIHINGYYAGFVPQYSLNILANINQDRMAKASLDEQQAVYLSMRLSIISQVAGSYFMLLGQREQLRIQSEMLDHLTAMHGLEQTRFQAGMSDATPVTDERRQIDNLRASMRATENSIAQIENALNVLIDRNPGPILTQAKIGQISLKGMIPAGIPSKVLKQRPDILIAQSQLKAAASNVGLAYAQFFPEISLTAILGLASLELVDLLKLNTGVLLAQGFASMPVLNGATYEQIEAAKAGHDASFYHYVDVMRQAFADVDDSLTNQQKMNLAYHDQREALLKAKKLYALMNTRYQAGAKDYRDVLNAQWDVEVAKQNENTAKMQQLDALVQVYQALAAGFG